MLLAHFFIFEKEYNTAGKVFLMSVLFDRQHIAELFDSASTGVQQDVALCQHRRAQRRQVLKAFYQQPAFENLPTASQNISMEGEAVLPLSNEDVSLLNICTGSHEGSRVLGELSGQAATFTQSIQRVIRVITSQQDDIISNLTGSFDKAPSTDKASNDNIDKAVLKFVKCTNDLPKTLFKELPKYLKLLLYEYQPPTECIEDDNNDVGIMKKMTNMTSFSRDVDDVYFCVLKLVIMYAERVKQHVTSYRRGSGRSLLHSASELDHQNTNSQPACAVDESIQQRLIFQTPAKISGVGDFDTLDYFKHYLLNECSAYQSLVKRLDSLRDEMLQRCFAPPTRTGTSVRQAQLTAEDIQHVPLSALRFIINSRDHIWAQKLASAMCRLQRESNDQVGSQGERNLIARFSCLALAARVVFLDSNLLDSDTHLTKRVEEAEFFIKEYYTSAFEESLPVLYQLFQAAETFSAGDSAAMKHRSAVFDFLASFYGGVFHQFSEHDRSKELTEPAPTCMAVVFEQMMEQDVVASDTARTLLYRILQWAEGQTKREGSGHKTVSGQKKAPINGDSSSSSSKNLVALAARQAGLFVSEVEGTLLGGHRLFMLMRSESEDEDDVAQHSEVAVYFYHEEVKHAAGIKFRAVVCRPPAHDAFSVPPPPLIDSVYKPVDNIESLLRLAK